MSETFHHKLFSLGDLDFPVQPIVQSPEIKNLFDRVWTCTDCPLHETRKTVVWHRGNGVSGIMFVGEAPGEKEDIQGMPFVGRSGRLLDTVLKEEGLEPAEQYICNTVKCRPPHNRNPFPQEVAQCMKYLHAQIMDMKPKLIVAVGRVSRATLIQNYKTRVLHPDPLICELTINGSKNDQLFGDGGKIPMHTIWHPAYVLRGITKTSEYHKQIRTIHKVMEIT